MEDIVFNAMTNFQFFCNDLIKQKNIDKLVPKGMTRSEWNNKKAEIIFEEIESMHRYLDQQAAIRLEAFSSANKQDIEKRFADTIARTIKSYKEKLNNYYL
jgi:hypothetical protein